MAPSLDDIFGQPQQPQPEESGRPSLDDIFVEPDIKREFIGKPLELAANRATRALKVLSLGPAAAIDKISGNDEQGLRLMRDIDALDAKAQGLAPSRQYGPGKRFLRGIADFVPYAASGPLGLTSILAQGATEPATTAIDQGVDTSTATALGMKGLGEAALYTQVPFAGKSIPRSMLQGAVINPIIGAAGRAASKGILGAGGYKDQADAVSVAPDAETLGNEVGMGMLFGALQGFGNRKKPVEKTEVIKSIKDFSEPSPVENAAKPADDLARDIYEQQLHPNVPVPESIPGSLMESDIPVRDFKPEEELWLPTSPIPEAEHPASGNLRLAGEAVHQMQALKESIAASRKEGDRGPGALPGGRRELPAPSDVADVSYASRNPKYSIADFMPEKRPSSPESSGAIPTTEGAGPLVAEKQAPPAALEGVKRIGQNVENVPRGTFDEQRAKIVLERMGMRYEGVQEDFEGHPDTATFTDPKTGSTLALPVNKITAPAIARKVREARAAFKEAQNVTEGVRSDAGQIQERGLALEGGKEKGGADLQLQAEAGAAAGNEVDNRLLTQERPATQPQADPAAQFSANLDKFLTERGVDLNALTRPRSGEASFLDIPGAFKSEGFMLYSGLPIEPVLTKLKALGSDIKAAMPHLEEIGKTVVSYGVNTYQKFVQGMKKILGDMWDSFKGAMIKVWQSAKSWNEKLGEQGGIKNPFFKEGAKEEAARAREAARAAAGERVRQKIDEDQKTGHQASEEELRASGFTGEQKQAYEKLRNDNVEDLAGHLRAQRKSEIWESIKRGTDKIAGVISTRLKRIHPVIKDAVRRYVYEVGKYTTRDNQRAYGFVEKFAKLDDATKIALSRALLNGEREVADAIAQKHGLAEDMNRARVVFEEARKRAVESGYEIGQTENYWARVVKDPEGLLNELRGTEQWSAIDDAILKKEREQGSALSDVERAQIADMIMRGYPAGSIPLSGTSHMKDRKFKTIPDQYLKYYMSADQSIMSYIRSMNNAIEAAKFFGRGKYAQKDLKLGIDLEIITEKDLADSIGGYIQKLKDAKQFDPKYEQPLREMMQAVFRPARSGAGVQMFKNLTYLQLLTQWTPSITQLVDIALAAEQVGYINTARVLGKAVFRKSDVKLQDIGIDRILEEFDGTTGSVAKLLTRAMKITGFEYMDRIGKETLLNGKLLQFKQQARAGNAKLRSEAERIFGAENADSVMEQLAAGKKTDDTLFLLYNKLSDVQPISAIEVPEKYLTSGAGKLFYALKTYQIKLMDVYRDQIINEMRHGTKVDRIEAARKFTMLTAGLVGLGMTTDEFKDWILGRKTYFNDLFIDNLWRIGGLSKYTISRYTEEGLGSAMLAQFAPPLGSIDAATKDLTEFIRKGELEKGARTWAFVPVGGKIYYWWFGRGKAIKAESEVKRQEKERLQQSLGNEGYKQYEERKAREGRRKQLSADLNRQLKNRDLTSEDRREILADYRKRLSETVKT
jgi:hypothetical protein